MNRDNYFNYIEEKLNLLATRINSRGKLNILNLHVHSENFYLHFFNKLFGWNLINLNDKLQNVEAIDLIDHSNKLFIQVSATSTKKKIESTLKKDILKTYSSYNFKFISISKDARNLRKKNYLNPHKVKFTPSNDIYDTISILNCIKSLEISKEKIIYQFIKNELGNEIDIVKLDSNIALIIDFLSKENMSLIITNPNIDSFEIDKKIDFNNLIETKLIIKDYSSWSIRLDSIYQEFDKLGVNKSYSVMQSIKKAYIEVNNNKKQKSADDVFLGVIDSIINKIQQSANFNPIPIDELEICVNVLVVDSFIKCGIFKNPKDYKYAST